MFNLASKYCFSLDKDREKATRCFLLLYNLENYVNGAIIEMGRLDRVRRRISKKLKDLQKPDFAFRSRRKDFSLVYLANDTHFYFICIDKVYKLLFKLAHQLDDIDIKRLAKDLRKTFNIRTVRNHLEHIDDRCLGFLRLKDKKKGVKSHISDFGNFIGDNFSFNGKQFPSGRASMLELKQIYTTLVEILDRKYASQDPGFVWRQHSEKVYKKIMQKLKKEKWFQTP
ncbi:hypothetical protein KKD61_03950 [Patescibacteria group bacterium]|nr:hypothetical protein [Patescibacteria group bacterium]